MKIPEYEFAIEFDRFCREQGDRLAFEEALETGKVLDAALILNPKRRDIGSFMRANGLIVPILWSNQAEEGKCYMVVDKTARKNMMEMLGMEGECEI